MQAKTDRARARMLLGMWGGWTELMARLLRERSFARSWLGGPEDALARTLLSDIDRETKALTRLRETMTALVHGLPVEQQQVLILRYEHKLSWVQIGIRLSYDERSVRRLESRAADALAARLEAESPQLSPAMA